MELNSYFETSEHTAKLDAVLAKAQGEIQPAAKDKTNPAFRSKYADLPAVWDACRDALAKHAISMTQWPIHSEDGRLHIITRLAHDGEWIRCHFSIPVSKQDAHGYGSAMTYAKRYTLAAALGVVADEDDDGNAASQRPAQQDSRPRAVAGGKASDKQLAFLSKLAQSSVFNEDEVARLAAVGESGDRERVSKALEWAQGEMEKRKAAQKEAAS